MRKTLISLLMAVIGMAAAHAQSRPAGTVAGTVVSQQGEPLVGAIIRAKDTGATLAVTDIDGKFSIAQSKMPKGGTITVSSMGFVAQDAKAAGARPLTIVMQEDAAALNEVVVVGYGTQKKTALTSSVEVIKADVIKQMPAVNLDQALAGQTAGLSVMSSTGDPSSSREATVRIRGIYDPPLLVVDGIPRFGTNTSGGEMRLSDLNPDDIESISVLKDAAAAAVYGARAANGVILVQTKRGKGSQKLRVNYSGQVNVQQATQLPHFLPAYEFAQLYNRAVDNSPATTYKKYTDEQLEAIRRHDMPNVYGDDDLLDYLDKTGYSTMHTASVSGGGKAVSYYISFGYTFNQGLYSGVRRKRFNYSAKLDAELGAGFKVALDMTGNRSNNHNTSSATITNAYSFSPLQPLRFTNGDLASINGANPLIPIYGIGGYYDDAARFHQLSATLRYEAPFLKGLSAYMRFTLDDNHFRDKSFAKPTALYLYDAEAGEYSVDPNTEYPRAKISMQQADRGIDNYLYEVGASYQGTFAGKHDVGLTLVANYQSYEVNALTAENQDLSGAYPEILGTTSSGRIVGTESRSERASLIGRATYGYANRYFVEASFRLDGSTRFTPDHRWGFFPTVSASWVLSNEEFFKDWRQAVLSNAKLRASTGVLGDDGAVGDFSYLLKYVYANGAGYNIGGNFRQGITLDTSSFPNPDLQWGKTRDYNIGVDLGFWGNRIGLTFEHYWRYRTNLITAAPSYTFPPSTGVEGLTPSVNFGKVKAWGWDLTLTHRNSYGDFKYDVALTLSHTTDKVLDYGDESTVAPNRRRTGRRSLLWFMYEADGLFRSEEELAAYDVDQDGQGNATLAPGDIKYKDQNGDKKITDLDRIAVHNSSYPDMNGSLRLGAGYKGFFFSVMFQGVAGYRANITDYYTLYSNSLPKFQDYHMRDSWTPDNPGATYPRVKFATANDNNRKESTFWIKDCNFVRLKFINIGYNFPEKLIRRIGMASASISLTASNLHTWTDLEEMDPESQRGYPIQRSYGMSLNIGF